MANLATINNNILADSGIDPLSLIVGTGTVNYVPKFTAEDTVANSQIFDNGTDVGIGTSSPFVKFDVRGEAMLLYRPAGNAYAIYSAANNTYSWQFGINNGSDYVICGGGFTGLGVEAFRITLGGNVGIGTSSPVTKLDVNGAGVIRGFLTTTDAIKLGGNTSAPASTDAFIYRPADNTLAFGTASAERMRLDVSGNLLIGLSSALANGKLQVAGNIGLSGNTQIRQATNSDGNTLQVFATQVIAGNLNSYSYGYSGGGLLASVSAGDSILLFDTGRTTSTEGRVKIANTTLGNVSFSVEKNGVTTLFASTLGNVGIGTNSPTQKLDVIESGTPTTASPGTVGRFVTAGGSGYDALIGIVGGTGGRSMIDLGDTSSSSIGRLGYDHTADFMFFQTNGSEKMRITAGGNLIVGGTTNTYSAKVSVENGFLAVSESGGSDIILRAAYGGIGPAIQVVAAAPLLFATSNTERMRIDADGRVLINRTASTNNGYYLQVTNGISASSSLLAQGTLSGYSGAGAFLSYESYGGRLEAYDYSTTSWKNIAITPNGGNVGIGTSSPSYKLDINGQTRFQDIVYFANGNWNKSGDGFNRLYFANAGRTYFGSGGGYEWRSDGDAALMVLTNGGNLLVGTTTDAGYKLDVSGTARITSNLLAQKVQVGTAATINDAAGVANTLQFANYTLGTFITGSADNYIYKTSNVIGTLSAQTLIFQTRSDVAGGGFAFVSGATPSVIANISSNGAVRFNVYGSGSFTGTRAYDLSVDASGNIIEVPVGAGTITGSGTTNYIPKFTSSSAIGNSIVQDYGDNVWVGSNTAGYGTLNIQRFVSAPYATLTLTDQATPSNPIGLYLRSNGSSPVGISSAGAPIAFYTGGPATNEGMRLDASGNLAIGSTTALGKLQISTSSGTTIFRSVVAFGGTANADNLSIKQDFITGVAANYLWSNSNYMLGVGRNGGTMPTTEADAIALSSFVVNSSGNVGIGTTSPTYKLHINTSNNNDGIAIHYPATSLQFPFYVGDNSNGVYAQLSAYEFEFKRNGGASTIKTVGSNNNLILQSANNLVFNTNGATERMRITDGGNVLVGTTTDAGYKLDVNGTGRYSGQLTVDYSSADAVIRLSKGASSIGNIDFVNEGNRFSIQDDGTRRLVIDLSGNVGIGTTSPTAKLEVTSSSLPTIISNTGTGGVYQSVLSLRSTSPSYGAGIQFYDGTNDGYISWYNQGLYFAGTGGATRMLINSSGNVGIGTTSPATLLHLQQSSGPTIRLVRTSNRFDITGDNDFMELNARDASTYMIFKTADTERMRIASGGNVLIGTTTDAGYKLDVNGIVRATGETIVSGGTLYLNNTDNSQAAYLVSTGSGGSAPLIFATNSSERMRLDASGNLGIGLSSNLRGKLDVGGFAVVGNGASGVSTEAIRFSRSGDDFRYQSIFTTSGGSAAANLMQFNLHNFSTATSQTTVMTLNGAGSVRLNAYGSGTFTGTPAYNLAVDASGNIIETAGSVVSGSGTTNYIPKWTSSSVIGNSMVTDDGTTVTVNGVSTVYFKVKASTNSGIDLLQDTAGTGYLWNRDNAAILFGTNNTERMRIVTGGNVGIGTSSPSYKLQVAGGDIAIDYGRYLRGGSGGDWNLINLYNGGTGDMEITMLNTNWYLRHNANATFAGRVGIGTTSPAYKLDIYGGASGTRTDVFVANAAANYNIGVLSDNNGFASTTNAMLFYTAATERMRITSGGNVLIGSTTNEAGSKLYVLNSITTDYSGTIGMRYNVSGQTNSYYKGMTGTALDNSTARGLHIFNYDADSNVGIQFWSNARPGSGTTPQAIITSSGNVGIGYTAPTEALAINGNLAVGGTASSGYKLFVNGSAYIAGSTNYIDGLTIFRTAAASEVMRITSGGNVGIGTSSPAYKLDVQGNAGLVTINTNGAISSGTEFISGSGNFASNSSGTDVVIRAGSTTLMTLKSGGNVGIGTPTPAYKLDVLGSFSFTTGGNYLQYNSGVLYHGNYYQFPSANDYSLFARTSGALIFGANDTERMRITSGGLVGIGATNPAEILELSTTTDPKIRFVDVGNLDAKVGIVGSTALGFEVNGSEAMRITSGGNVLVGSQNTLGLSLQRLTVTEDSSAAFLGIYRNNTAISQEQGGIQWMNGGAGTSIAKIAVNTSSDFTDTGNLLFFTKSSGSSQSEKMRITSGGNVLMGTTSDAGYKLDVTGTLRVNGNNNTAVALTVNGSDASEGLVAKFARGASEKNFYISATNNQYVNLATEGNFRFKTGISVNQPYTSGNDPMVLTSTGNVGIGTSSPTVKLQVSGTTLFEGGYANFLASGTIALRIGADGSNDIFMPSGRNLSISAEDNILFRTSGALTERFRITSSGNVGIGTSSPSGQLEVYEGFYKRLFVSYPNSTTTRLSIGHNFYIDNDQSPEITSFTNSSGTSIFRWLQGSTPTERMRLSPSGNLLIGTTSDAGQKLQVNGNGYFNGNLETTVDLVLSRTDVAPAIVTVNGNLRLYKSSGAGAQYSLSYDNDTITFSGSIKTAAPSGGTAATWKLGSRISNTCGLPLAYSDFVSQFMNTNKVIEVEIGGVTVYIPTVTPGWC